MKKDMAGILLGSIFYLGLYPLLFTDLSRMFYIDLVFRKIYLPVSLWSWVSLYTVLWAALYREPVRNVISRAVILGMLVHVPVLLYKLVVQISSGSPLSAVYIYYTKLITVAGLAGIYFICIRLLKRISGDDKGYYLLVPVFLLSFHLSVLYAIHARVILYVSIALWALVYFIYAQSTMREGIARILRRFASNERLVVLSLFALAFILRYAFAIQMLHQTGGGSNFIDGSDDGRTYNQIGLAISQNIGNILNPKYLPSPYDPGYSIFLAVIFKIFGHNFYAVTFAQSIINSLTVVIIYFIGKALFSRAIGTVGGAFLCFDQASIMHSVVLGTEALFTALVAAALLCIIYHLKRRFRRKYILLAGICLGLAAITRYMLFMLPIFILAVYLFINGIDLRKKIVNVALMYVFMLICIMPVTLVNYINTHEFHLVEKSGDRMDIVWYNSYLGREDMCPSNLIFVEAGFDPFKKPAEAALFVLKHPVKFTGLCYRVWSKRLRNFLFWPNFGFSDPLILVNPSRMPNEFGSTMEFYFFIVYIIGSFVLLQGLPADRARLVLLVPILYFIFIHAILFMFSTVRYRVPVIPYLSIIFAVGLNRIFSFVRREQPRTTSETAVQHNRYRGL